MIMISYVLSNKYTKKFKNTVMSFFFLQIISDWHRIGYMSSQDINIDIY